MKKKSKYLLKNLFLFSISNFVPKLLTFLLVRLYTSKLSTMDYGIFDLISTTSMLLIPILSLDIQDAVLRFTMDKQIKKEDIFTSAIRINFFGFMFLIIVSIFLYCFNFLNLELYFYIFLILYYFTGSIQNLFTLFCKGLDLVSSIVFGSILSTFITILFNVLFLVVFNFGIYGFLVANVAGVLFFDLFILFKEKLYKYYSKKCNNNLSFKMIKYSFPLVFNSISWWINNASDRYILTYFCGVSVSGIYAISYKIPNILSSFQNVFCQAWSISAIKDFDKEDIDGFIGNTYSIMNFSMVFLCSLFMIFNVYLSRFLYSNDFFEAWKFIAPLLLSVVFNSMSLFIGGIFTAVKDTKSISFSTIVGAIINILLNFFLIKQYGAYGAAIATLFSYFCVLIFRLVFVKKHIHFNTNMSLNYFSYFLLFIQMCLAFYGNKFIFIQVCILIFILVIYRSYISKVFSLVLNKLKK